MGWAIAGGPEAGGAQSKSPAFSIPSEEPARTWLSPASSPTRSGCAPVHFPLNALPLNNGGSAGGSEVEPKKPTGSAGLAGPGADVAMESRRA